MEAEWTIDELGEQVALALSVDYDEPSNGQVRAVPDRRSIRYYTSLGLVDRPLAMRGRTALYGRRHLHQLVAIKRLQAQGRSLAEVQTQLAGASDRQLASLARVPQVSMPRRPPEPAPGRGDFWRAAPAEVDSAAARPPDDTAASSPVAAPGAAAAAFTTSVRFELAPGVSLHVDTRTTPTAADAAAIAVAAQQLLEQLRIRGLLATSRFKMEEDR